MNVAESDAKANDVLRWARVALTLVLIPFTHSAFRDQYGAVPLISDIDAAIHEFGHAAFQPFGVQPFGETMVILGGSLMQVTVPLAFMAYFLFGPKPHRDLHAAMLCLWWTAISVLGVSIYMGDARAGQLMLINGATGEDDPEFHDWHNLLSRWGALNRDTIYAGRVRAMAALMAFVAITVGLYAAYASHRTQDSQRPTPDA